MVPSSVLIAMNFILSVLETSDGSLRKKRWLLPETRFLLSDDEFLYPDLSRVFEAWLVPPQRAPLFGIVKTLDTLILLQMDQEYKSREMQII